ncbi:MAG: heavy metal-binding domain-containing protein [Bacteroidia bacterium]
MKKKILKTMTMIALAITTSTSFAFAQQKENEKEENHYVGEPGKGPHGGTMQEADPYHAEIAVKNDKVMLYLLDGDAKMMSNDGVIGSANFVMPDGKAIKEILTAHAEDGFEVNNPTVVNYKSCKVTFTVKGKAVTAHFKNYATSEKATGKMYTCVMHPEVLSDKPGKCPKCNMDLVVKKGK